MSQRPQIVHARFVPEERVSCAVGDRARADDLPPVI